MTMLAMPTHEWHHKQWPIIVPGYDCDTMAEFANPGWGRAQAEATLATGESVDYTAADLVAKAADMEPQYLYSTVLYDSGCSR